MLDGQVISSIILINLGVSSVSDIRIGCWMYCAVSISVLSKTGEIQKYFIWRAFSEILEDCHPHIYFRRKSS